MTENSEIAALHLRVRDLEDRLKWLGRAVGLLVAQAYSIPNDGPSLAMFEGLGMTAKNVVPASASNLVVPGN